MQPKGLSRVISNITIQKALILPFFMVQLSYLYMTVGKTIALTICSFVGKVISAFLYTASVGHSFLSKEQASFNFMAAVTACSDFEAQEIKSVTVYIFFFLIYLHRSDGSTCHDLWFWMLSFKPAFSFSFFTFIKRIFNSFLLSGIRVVSST